MSWNVNELFLSLDKACHVSKAKILINVFVHIHWST